jgi:Ser/Thr protein kinase RdoA (MazF antagonist)
LRWETLPPDELNAHAQRLRGAAERVAGVIVPTLTHRDLFLRNTLAREGRFAAILDFEHARFTDPVMEFVKLDALLFKPHQGSEEPFMRGYRSVRPEPFPREEERRSLCWGLEFLGAMPFYARNGQTDELERARTAIRATRL